MAETLVLIALAALAVSAAEVGQPAPALVVAQLDGSSFDLGALRGKVVAVDFWASWCLPCRAEMPTLDAFYRRYHGQGFELIGVSADRPHDRAEVQKVMQAFSYPAAMLHDAKVNGFGAPSVLPILFVIDANGVLRARLTPDQTPVTEKSLAELVLPLLPQRPAAQPAAEHADPP